jgi:Dyp-type peroxidase family
MCPLKQQEEQGSAMSIPFHLRVAPKSNDASIQEELANTQGYIMVGHGRDDVWHALIRFRAGADPDAVRNAVKGIVAVTQPTPTTELVSQDKADKSKMVVSALGFTWPGYKRMGFANRADEFSLEFQQGFASRSQQVTGRGSDTWDSDQWDPHNGYHALLILAAGLRADGESLLQACQGQINTALGNVAEATWLKGGIHRRTNGKGSSTRAIFGFKDGVSQPVLLTDPRWLASTGRSSVWDPRAAPSLVLIQEPIPGMDGQQKEFGSYMAFLDIEVNGKAFKEAARGLSQKLGVSESEAQELIIGRRLDGKQLIDKTKDNNDFVADTDKTGALWPFPCHTRKMNSRQPGQEHHRIVRRGVAYEDGSRVGLYFQCFQASLQEQFEFLLKHWANFRSQPGKGCGVDPLMGVDPNYPQQWPKAGTPLGAVPEAVGSSISNLTTIHGGDYFYFPSIPFLKNMGEKGIAQAAIKCGSTGVDHEHVRDTKLYPEHRRTEPS